MSTRAFEPLKLNALPNFPDAAHVAFTSVPVLPFPDASAVDAPDPSSNPNAATRPAGLAVPGAGAIASKVTAAAAAITVRTNTRSVSATRLTATPYARFLRAWLSVVPETAALKTASPLVRRGCVGGAESSSRGLLGRP